MMKSKLVLLLSVVFVAVLASSCRQPIELPAGVEVLVNGESIEGEKVILVSQGQPARLQASGLEPNSNVRLLLRKLGINLREENFTVNSEGTLDEMVEIPEIDASATALVNYTDWSGLMQENKFTLKVD